MDEKLTPDEYEDMIINLQKIGQIYVSGHIDVFRKEKTGYFYLLFYDHLSLKDAQNQKSEERMPYHPLVMRMRLDQVHKLISHLNDLAFQELIESS